eukprot:COSAG02_NODE_8432_length_2571_cov_6.514159_3_plen_476_part_00
MLQGSTISALSEVARPEDDSRDAKPVFKITLTLHIGQGMFETPLPIELPIPLVREGDPEAQHSLQLEGMRKRFEEKMQAEVGELKGQIEAMSHTHMEELERTTAQLNDKLQLLDTKMQQVEIQMNGRVFFGAHHSVHRSVEELTMLDPDDPKGAVLAALTAAAGVSVASSEIASESKLHTPIVTVAGQWRSNAIDGTNQPWKWNKKDFVSDASHFELEDTDKKIKVARPGVYRISFRGVVTTQNIEAQLFVDEQMVSRSPQHSNGGNPQKGAHLNEMVELKAGQTISVKSVHSNHGPATNHQHNVLCVELIGDTSEQVPASAADVQRYVASNMEAMQEVCKDVLRKVFASETDFLMPLPSRELMPLSLCTELRKLTLMVGKTVGDTEFKLDFVEGLNKLEEVTIDDAQIRDITPLSTLPSLWKLALSNIKLVGNGVFSLGPLAEHPALVEVCTSNSFSSLFLRVPVDNALSNSAE